MDSEEIRRDYTRNHYVPQWYQRRFLPTGQGKFFYLDLKPEGRSRNGHAFIRRDVLRWGTPRCFVATDLYSTVWGSNKNTDIERYYFGKIDNDGRDALSFFENFDIRQGLHRAYQDLVQYMSVQKLRTPKGMQAFAAQVGSRSANATLLALQRYASMHCATWTDAVWQIADAASSPVKFLLSDHPATVYNRSCFPGSRWCKGVGDPDIRMVASQTLFPLSADKLIVLTNLAWVRNPYQSEIRIHPNPSLFRTTMFKATDIQTGRTLTEREVLEINYIIKSRALRYVAAAKLDWLYPEKYLPSTHWRKFGDGYLLMPDPRDVHMGGTIYVGYDNGRSEAFSEYGHRPWDAEFENEKRSKRESATLSRFQDEFATRFGPVWRGWSSNFGNEGPTEDQPQFFNRHLERAAKRGVKPPPASPWAKRTEGQTSS